MPKTELSFEKLKAELNKLTTNEALKAEITKITNEIQNVRKKISQSPQAQAQLKKLETLYKDAQKSLHSAQKQLEAELKKAKVAIKNTSKDLEKKIYKMKEDAIAAKDRFTGPTKKAKKASRHKTSSKPTVRPRKKVTRKKATKA